MTTTTCPAPAAASSSKRGTAIAGFAVVASLFLAACGGSSESAPPPPAAVTEVPASAVATDASLEMFAITLAKSDTTEPLGLDMVKAMPTSETEDPVPTP